MLLNIATALISIHSLANKKKTAGVKKGDKIVETAVALTDKAVLPRAK